MLLTCGATNEKPSKMLWAPHVSNKRTELQQPLKEPHLPHRREVLARQGFEEEREKVAVEVAVKDLKTGVSMTTSAGGPLPWRPPSASHLHKAEQ